jgi:hypothetical protein
MVPNIPLMGGLDLAMWQFKKPIMATKHMATYQLFKKDIL